MSEATMEYLVKVMPSGHEFHAVAQETLLDAALRSGLNVNFGCASGTCGECHARLVEGRLGQDDFHDYRISEADVAQGKFLLCTAHAASDLIIEAGEAKSVRDIPRQSIKCKVQKLQDVGERLSILQLRTPRTSPLRFLAGQHVELLLPDGRGVDCSIASCPCNGSQLQFHLSRRGGDGVAGVSFDGLRYGTEVQLDGPFGEVTLDDDSPRPLLLLAQGVEMASLKSVIEHAINLDLGQPLRFFWLADGNGHYLENHCRSWGEALDDYRFLPLDYQAEESEQEQAGRVIQAVGAEVSALGEWDIYCAGSEDFVTALQQGLCEAGAQPHRLFATRLRRIPRGMVSRAMA